MSAMYLLVAHLCVAIGWVGSAAEFKGFSSAFDDGGRIIGGEPADIKDIPFQLSLRTTDNDHFCGASVISDLWAVSAAHCFTFGTAGLTLVAGASFLSKGGSKHDVVQVISHPNYDPHRYNNDIAVLKVKTPFPLGSAGVKSISLASSSPGVGALAQTSGWGVTTEGGYLEDQLQRVLIPIISNQNCNSLYPNKITASMICAGYPEGGKDACQGDSGGPLVVDNKLVGIVSWGVGCAEPGNPGVYARVDKFYGWIKKRTGI